MSKLGHEVGWPIGVFRPRHDAARETVGAPAFNGKKERAMTQNNPLKVRLERSANELGAAMNEFRSWLDAHKIQPTGFRSDAQAFEINFAREGEARLFESTFA
jgi:hypothetical protein